MSDDLYLKIDTKIFNPSINRIHKKVVDPFYWQINALITTMSTICPAQDFLKEFLANTFSYPIRKIYRNYFTPLCILRQLILLCHAIKNYKKTPLVLEQK